MHMPAIPASAIAYSVAVDHAAVLKFSLFGRKLVL